MGGVAWEDVCAVKMSDAASADEVKNPGSVGQHAVKCTVLSTLCAKLCAAACPEGEVLHGAAARHAVAWLFCHVGTRLLDSPDSWHGMETHNYTFP